MMGHILCDLVEQSLTYHEHGPNRKKFSIAPRSRD